jgi:hypothetical protein
VIVVVGSCGSSFERSHSAPAIIDLMGERVNMQNANVNLTLCAPVEYVKPTILTFQITRKFLPRGTVAFGEGVPEVQTCSGAPLPLDTAGHRRGPVLLCSGAWPHSEHYAPTLRARSSLSPGFVLMTW